MINNLKTDSYDSLFSTFVKVFHLVVCALFRDALHHVVHLDVGALARRDTHDDVVFGARSSHGGGDGYIGGGLPIFWLYEA